MRRISIVLFMIGLLTVSVDAQILNTLTDVIRRARNDLNVDTSNATYLPLVEGNGRIREAMSLVNRLVGDNRTNTVVPLVVNTYKYGLKDSVTGSPDTVVLARSAITSVQWIRADSIKTLTFIPRASWSEQAHQTTKGIKGLAHHPSHFDFYDDTLYIHPVPSEVDTLYVTSTDNIYGLDTTTTLAIIHEDYRPAILAYVVYHTARARQHPLVALYKQDYERLWMLLFPGFNPQVANVQ